MKKISLKEKFNLFNDHWNPKIVGTINNHDVKLAKVKGEFIWHNHKNEDELFYIIKGTLTIKFHNKIVELKEEEMLIVPKDVDHRQIAENEVWLLLIEPNNIKHTGEVKSKLTVEKCEKI